MDIAFLFPFILLIGVMFLMTRSAKNKQRQAMQMRDSMEPGTGVRTIGGMYALVKEVHEDTVLLEITPGVSTMYAKNAIGAVLEPEEYERIISGEPAFPDETPVVPDDASALTGEEQAGRDDRVGLDKTENGTAEGASGEEPGSQDSRRDGENGSKS
ncbi:preprotein translocase subunit YajC [Streptomyces sodiiphilus]|uniref:Preprotein translocase subunit YajC n=1 Tax=Streptomyces sodiiphilus TaxID=226217 RepID=A0ABP5A2E3_9ACTN